MGFKASLLLPALKVAFKVVSKKNTLPILDCFLLSEGAFGGTVITASDLENTVSIENDVQLDTLPFCVNAELFLKTIEGLGDEEVSIEKKDDRIVVFSERGEYLMPIESAEDFPTSQLVEPINLHTVMAAELMHHLGIAAKFTANDELRPIMAGVFVGNGNVVATNAHVLYKGMMASAPSSDFIISTKSIGVLNALVESSKLAELSLRVVDRNVLFVCGSHTLITRIIEGRYPNYDSVIPKEGTIIAKFNKSVLEKALKRVRVFSNKASSLVRLDFMEGQVDISAQDLDFSIAANESVVAEVEGEGHIGFSSEKLLLCLQARTEEVITIVATDPTRAALIMGDSADTILLMPMQIK